MSTSDFVPWPWSVTFNDEKEVTLSFVNPIKQTGIPTWGKHCWWTDPPPPDCAPNLRQISKQNCTEIFGGNELFSKALNFRASAGSLGKVADPEDLNNFLPHLLPLIKTIDQLARASGIDLANEEFSGMTVKFHR